MFENQWVRKPNFKDVSLTVDYNDYWKHRGWEINKNLKSREKITLDLIEKDASVMDVGSGNSLLPVKLKEKGVDVSVSDISDEVLKGYEQYGIPSTVIDLDAQDFSALSKNVDYVILFEVLEHLKLPENTIESLKPYTKRFLITVPNSGAYFYRLNLLFRGRFFTQWTYHPSEHLRYWTHLDFLDWLEALDLEVEEAVATDGSTLNGLLSFLPNLWKNMFANRILYICKVKEEKTE